MTRLEPITDELPSDLEALRAEAVAERFRHVERLMTEWRERTTRFDRDGEMLLAARVNGELAGIGGITIEPTMPNALRMRRFYVRPAFRRAGIGRQLVSALLQHAGANSPVTANAAAGSETFWEGLGFRPDQRDGYTHVLERGDGYAGAPTETARPSRSRKGSSHLSSAAIHLAPLLPWSALRNRPPMNHANSRAGILKHCLRTILPR